MILYGWGKQTRKNYGPVSKHACSHCKNEEYWTVHKITFWFTLFFIPIIPYKTIYFYMCPICESGIELPSDKFEEFKFVAENNKALIDGKIKEDEYTNRLNNLDKDKIMYCSKCGKENEDNASFCKHCGLSLAKKESNNSMKTENKELASVKIVSSKLKPIWKIIKIILIFFVISGVISAIISAALDDAAITNNEAAITKANDGLSSFELGDNQTAINKFQQVKNDVTSNEDKIIILINLAYVYLDELDNEQALASFEEALTLAKFKSFHYYFISGEIALLEDEPGSAILNFNKAYELNSDDFQLNSAMAIFYLDLEELFPEYEDYVKALFYAKQAYKDDVTQSKNVKQTLATAYFMNENYDETISLLSTSNLNQKPFPAYLLGLSYLVKGDEENAVIYLQKSIDGGIEVSQEIYDYLNDR